jgi:uncharacterized protein
MLRTRWMMLAIASIMISACVTINVYFPEAEAEKAAEQFIDKVIGPMPAGTDAEGKEESGKRPIDLGALFAIVPRAHAQQADISIETPAIKAIQSRMSERFQSSLAAHFDSGALGLTRDGLVELRDPAAAPLAARTALKQAVADDNRDRNAVYREIAVANGHPEWEADIRSTFAKQWVQSARTGWWFQDAAGSWKRK